MDDLQKPVVLVTGGAQGIGKGGNRQSGLNAGFSV